MNTADQLPMFTDIKPQEIASKLETLLNKNRQEIQQLLSHTQNYRWDNFIRHLEDINDRLHYFWAPINHLNNVSNSPELRKAYHECLPTLSAYRTEIGHNYQLYEAVQSIANSQDFYSLDFAQRKVIENDLRDFELAGIALSADKKKRFAELAQELSQLTNHFEENVMDATQAWRKHITDEKELAGIPELAVEAARQLAQSLNHKGWVFGLDIPSYLAVMQNADSKKLREEMYFAYVTRASKLGHHDNKWNNDEVVQQILCKRLELAQLLDFKNYAEYSLATKMVKQPQQVLEFIQQLAEASLPKAREEFAALCHFAAEELGIEQLEAWDVAYASEKLRQHYYAISREELRPYFPEDRVISGLFAIVKKLFGVDVTPVENADVWHPDVRCYAVYDQQDKLISYFYMDLYSRENKRSGAWMDDAQGRRRLADDRIQLPIAFITCNFNSPMGDDPCLMTHEEVVTLFHEFGHSLQHMLTKIDYIEVSGINGIPWDAVEVASQFLEHWTWEKESIAMISGHYKTGEILPDNLYQRLHAIKNFQAAMLMLRQLEFAWFDFRLHMEFDPKEKNQIQRILDEVREKVTVFSVPKFNKFQNSFLHVFSGSYAAGYYSYKWAEVMASDAFSLFEENGIFDTETSNRFLDTILSSGGAEEPLELFVKFRGREPRVEALLKSSGIV